MLPLCHFATLPPFSCFSIFTLRHHVVYAAFFALIYGALALLYSMRYTYMRDDIVMEYVIIDMI